MTEAELEKAKNKLESAIAFEDLNLLSRAANLAFYELLGDAAEINRYEGKIKQLQSRLSILPTQLPHMTANTAAQQATDYP